MSELSHLTLAVMNFFYVGALPFIFFRGDGTRNLRWWLTAWPYIVYPAVLIAGHLGYLTPFVVLPGWTIVIATLMHAVSIALIAMTIGTHRIPISLWHQSNDAPVNIVTYGPYALVRHPFYSAFILCQLAGLLGFVHPASAVITIYSVVILSLTARKEERKLLASQFGAEYRAYLERTGRFFPRLG
jgi:protein-S-isoprenylcysteine O-methyltransferase Ste14